MVAEEISFSNIRTEAQLQHYKPTRCYENFVARFPTLQGPADLYFDEKVNNDSVFDMTFRAPSSSPCSTSSEYSGPDLDLGDRRSALYEPRDGRNQKEEVKDINNDIFIETRNDEFMRTIIEQNEDINEDIEH